MPYRPLPVQAFDLLVVATQVERREALLQHCRERLPRARLESAAVLSDAVLRLARGGVQLVVLDLQPLQPLSPAVILVMRGMAPGVRVVGVGGSDPATPGLEWVADALELADWLRRADRADD